MFFSMTLLVTAQEICNNAIDDDGDMLVDLNDDECSCSDIVPLTSITGSLCTNNLTLNLTVANATDYQWYKDGVALVGQTNSTIILSDNDDEVEGSYEVVANTATDCVISIAEEIEIPSFETYLGVETICTGDTIFFGPFAITTQGTISRKEPAIQDGAVGCDSIITLDVVVQQDEKYIVDTIVCEGTEYIFGSQILTTTGLYEEAFMSSAGCDSVVDLTITFLPLDPIVMEASICRGETFVFRDISETEPGMYPTNFVSAEGCDTTFIVDLTVIEPVESDRLESICAGGEIEIEGTTYNTEGDFEISLIAASGCDSIVNLTIDVLDVDTYSFDREICQGVVFVYGDISATEAGEYTTLIQTPGVCDSLITFDLSVTEPNPQEERLTICAGEVLDWRGDTYDTEGIYNTTESSTGDCDINHQLNLTVTEPVFTLIDEEICAGGSVEIAGEIYIEAGSFEVPLTTAAGCDSILQVTIVEMDAEVFQFQESICRGEIFIYGDIEETTAGTFETLIETQGVCDSLIVIELSVDEPTPMVQNETICQGLSFEWNGEILEDAGTYENLVTAVGECDELFVLELEVTAPEVVFESMDVCSNNFPFDFQDLKIEEAGSYFTVISVDGECDVEYQLEVGEITETESFQDVDLCAGDVFILHDIETEVGGTFTTLVPGGNEAGCDSIVTVNVLAKTITTSQEDMEVCPGESFLWNGMTISTEGDHEATLVNESGCDSIATLTLTFNTLVTFDMAFEICEGETFSDYGLNETETGQYTALLSSGVGCDSLINIDLLVNPLSSSTMEAVICEGEVFELFDIEATEADTYTTLVPGGNATGCDSTVTVNLMVVSHEDSEVSMEICEGEVYEFGGIEYSETGTYTETMISTVGCDSTVSLLLEVTPLGRRTDEVLICPGDEFIFNDIVTTEAGTFETRLQNAGECDSLITVIVEMDDPDGLLVLGEDKLINIGSEVDIVPEFISPSLTDFEWLDENGNILSEESELFAFAPVEDTWVELFATNEHGCAVSERLNVEVELIIDIFVPNVIAPNQVDANSYFTVGANESVVGIKELYIYDRWGELMFTDSHEGNLDTYLGWDGTFKNKTVLQGVYAYLVIFEIIDGSEVEKKGSLTVLN